MNKSLCIYTGNMTSFNVRQTLANIGKMLNKEFELHHVTSKPEKFCSDIPKYFEIHSPVQGNTHIDAARCLNAYFNNNTPDVVTQIGRVPVDGNIISLFKNKDTKFVCRYSGDLFYEYKLDSGVRMVSSYIIKNIMGKMPMNSASKFIAMGPRQKSRLISRGLKPTDVEVLPPPIDTERLFPSSSVNLGIPPEKNVILYVGRVSERKGAKTLETIIPEVLDKRQDLHFVLVGAVNYKLRFAKRYENQVTIVGSVSPDEVPKYHKLADLYIHPSLTEGISRSLLEAISSDTPVITRDVGDQAYATTNYFTTDDDLVSMIVDFEALPNSDPSRFSIKKLKKKYVKFFHDA